VDQRNFAISINRPFPAYNEAAHAGEVIMPSDSRDTIKISVPGTEGASRPMPSSAGVRVDVAGLSDQGKVRKNNEDCFLVCRYGRFLTASETNLPADDVFSYFAENGCAMIIADGMGGHWAGEVASRLAISSLLNYALSTPDWVFRFDDETMAQKVMERAVERTQRVKELLVHEASQNPSLRGFGTTLALAWGVGKELFILHVGDSRVYLFRDGKLRQLTRDHTVAQDLANTGAIPENQVAGHFFRHHLSQCLTASAAKVKPDVRRLELEDGDLIMLCSDGLSDMVPGDKLTAILAQSNSAKATCVELIDKALTAGGKDNITAIVARYQFTPGE
jgi:protein phosphatase